MKGSVKQIAWAEDIQRAVVKGIDRLIEWGMSEYSDNPTTAVTIAFLQDRRADLLCEKSAAVIIEAFINFRTRAEGERLMDEVARAYRDRFPLARSDRANHLLGKDDPRRPQVFPRQSRR